MTANDIKSELRERVEPGRKSKNEWFFKTGEGQYSEGDQFIGVRVPDIRVVAKKHRAATFDDIKALLGSPIHEHRLVGAIILTYKFDKNTFQDVYDFYIEQVLHNTTLQIAPDFKAFGPRRGIDNWDIVDSSAHKIVGRYLADKSDRSILYTLSEHQGLWQNRVAMMANWWLINKKQDFTDCITLAEKFITHKHDLMHKVTGWMLREMGKQDRDVLTSFLDQHSHKMPRVMLRYSIEKLPEPLRHKYLG